MNSALDNQIYVAAVSPARDETASYVAWGHSTVVDPMGQVIATTEASEDIVYAEIGIIYIANPLYGLIRRLFAGGSSEGIDPRVQAKTV
jgi:hypothetical protein